MSHSKFVFMWISLTLILLLTLFSIYGAFLGSSRAEIFFNSLPLSIFWILLLLLLLCGFIAFKQLVRNAGLLLIHLGFVCVLIGAMWSSDNGHQIQRKFFGIDKIRMGTLLIYEGLHENRVIDRKAQFQFVKKGDQVVFSHGDHILTDQDDVVFTLPFKIKLNDFRIEYYDSPRLMIKSSDDQEFSIDPIIMGKAYNLDHRTQIEITGQFQNFKMRRVNGKMEAYDSEMPGSNPAIRIKIIHADGTQSETFAFARFRGHMRESDRYTFTYQLQGMIRDYFSDVEIIEEEKTVLKKSIEVNRPLHYKGYHFYQSSYDAKNGEYTVLSVTSDSGWYVVFIGYLLLLAGTVWQMWAAPILKDRRCRKNGGRNGH